MFLYFSLFAACYIISSVVFGNVDFCGKLVSAFHIGIRISATHSMLVSSMKRKMKNDGKWRVLVPRNTYKHFKRFFKSCRIQ